MAYIGNSGPYFCQVGFCLLLFFFFSVITIDRRTDVPGILHNTFSFSASEKSSFSCKFSDCSTLFRSGVSSIVKKKITFFILDTGLQSCSQ